LTFRMRFASGFCGGGARFTATLLTWSGLRLGLRAKGLG
jgi:hypothetical protein